jgi:hypothetical protein
LQHAIPGAAFAHVLFGENQVLDLALVLSIRQEVNGFLASAVIENQQIIR